MKKFLVGLYVFDNGKKITAIKVIRRVTGMGLVEAKTFVESNNGATVKLMLNAEQVALIFEAQTDDECNGFDQPEIRMTSCKQTSTEMDFSHLTPY